jgi:hypothetical protein
MAGLRRTGRRQWIAGDTELQLPQSQRSTIKDSLFDRVSLLLPMTGTNGSTTFVDQSQYAAAITANGGAVISTSTFPDGAYSGNGSNSYLSLSSTSQSLLGDFTIEAYVRLTSLPSYSPLVECRSTASFSNYVCGMLDTGRIDFVTAAGRVTGTSTSVSTGVTTHVAFERYNGIISLYVDGVKDAATFSLSTSIPPVGGTMRVGATIDPSYMNGQLRWLRITQTARYRGAFTPPPLPLSLR